MAKKISKKYWATLRDFEQEYIKQRADRDDISTLKLIINNARKQYPTFTKIYGNGIIELPNGETRVWSGSDTRKFNLVQNEKTTPNMETTAPTAQIDYSRYHFYTDGGHGWLKVPLEELNKLGIGDKISGYSYMDDKFAYLEEDADLGVFLSALGIGWSPDETTENKEQRRKFWGNVKNTDTSMSNRTIFIRNLNQYESNKMMSGGGLGDEDKEKMKAHAQTHSK